MAVTTAEAVHTGRLVSDFPAAASITAAPRTWLSFRPFLVGADLLAVLLALVVTSTISLPGLAAVGVSVVAVAFGLSAYRSRLTLSVLDDVPALGAAALTGVVAGGTVADARLGHVDMFILLGVLLALLVVFRATSYVAVRQARSTGYIAHRALVLGAGEIGQDLARAALDRPEHGLVPVGFLDDDAPRDASLLPVPHLGGYADLSATIQRLGVSEIIVAWGRTQDSSLIEIMRECDRLHCEIFAVPRFFELQHRSRDMDELWGIPLVRFRRATWRSVSWRAKRALDILVAGTALLMFAPMLALVALAVRLELGKGVIFRQVRIGVDGTPFTLFKFRSLRLPEGPGASPVWSINGDARLGPVGRFLRASSIDELPQLVNVLRGEMSIVGPRPERPVFVDQFAHEVPRYHGRHRTPAGLTGWAQVNGLRGDTSIEERARFDNYYIQNWSLWLDAKIVARTVGTVLFRRGS
ncbi:sugar transferase [Nocardioides sp.]|uniref:sugar transferase n=1 Tax=Nocardioides sp. TaxID=35761 RepID=UPI0027201C45|nr:sugar transferase [Nocardioides sp.]MDO9454933.1 sugar transferase [Nocardioides sp.]